MQHLVCAIFIFQTRSRKFRINHRDDICDKIGTISFLPVINKQQ